MLTCLTDTGALIPRNTRTFNWCRWEGTHAKATIVAPNAVNSCSSNSTTGTTVCVANNTDVYLIDGSKLSTTLTSGATGPITVFSGGAAGPCENCGVVVDSTTNTAWITIGFAAPHFPDSGIQPLNLSVKTFGAPLMSTTVEAASEGIAIDPVRHLLLSPSDLNFYGIFQSQTPNTFFYLAFQEASFDSAGEDCTTGILVSPLESGGQLFISDLTQATFTPSTHLWTAPLQYQNFSGTSFGTTGIAVAPNTHLGVITGEDGDTNIGVIQLPSTSGSGIPSLVDYAGLNLLDNVNRSKVCFDPIGQDPHTVTAYVSPNTGRAYGVVVGNGDEHFPFPCSSAERNTVAVVDLQLALSAPRTPGTNTVDPNFDLVKNDVVRFVAVH